MVSPDRPAVVGERLLAGRYRLSRQIGRGGMGAVWVAEDELLCRPVAVKEIVISGALSDEERRAVAERTLREARAAARLGHPSAVRVFDVFEDEDRSYLVMELVAGQPLADLVRDHGPLPPLDVARIGLQLAGALVAAHDAGIVHRDVKPGNVIVGDDGHVTLTDFGIAAIAGDPSITGTGLLIGSPAYISPERARGGTPTPTSDVWSLGATLYHAVEGHPPFDRGEPIPTLTAVATEPVPAPARAGPLAPTLLRMLAKEPAERPQLAEVERTLRSVLAGEPATAPLPAARSDPGAGAAIPAASTAPAMTPVVPATPPWPGGAGRWVLLVILAVLVFAAAAAATASA